MISKTRNVVLASLLSLGALALSPANASSLIGDEVDVVLTGAIELADFGVLVGPDVELQGGDFATNWGAFLFPTESIDIGADSILMTFDTSLGENAVLTFGDLDFGAGIGGVTLISTIAAVTDANLSFTADSITLDLAGWFETGEPGTIELQLTAVPLPAAGWMLLMGLGVLGFRRQTGRQAHA